MTFLLILLALGLLCLGMVRQAHHERIWRALQTPMLPFGDDEW